MVAMVAVRVVEVAADHVVDMVTVLDRLVPAVGTVDMLVIRVNVVFRHVFQSSNGILLGASLA